MTKTANSTTRLQHLQIDPLKLIEHRVHRGLSQRALATLVGIAPSTLSDIENSRRLGSPTLRVRIAQALGVSLTDLTRDRA